MKVFPYSRQLIDKKDINSVVDVMKSDFLTKGSKTIEFENKSKKILSSKYAAGVINASSALILSCKALNLKKNDIVWTSANTYIASINCAIHCGAKIDLVEINEEDYNIDVKKLEKKLKESKKRKILPKILIVVHLAGYPCDLKEIKNLSKRYNFKIIEDASHAFGAKYLNSKIGDCKYSDISVFSFHPVKVVTSAEGGLITTNEKKIFERIISLRENGKKIDKKNRYYKKDKNFYDIVDLGYNFRINEINASLGISQIKKTKEYIKRKAAIAKNYFKKLDRKIYILPKYSSDRRSSWHLFIVRFRKKISKKKILNYLRKKKIYANTHYIPLNYFSFIRPKLKGKRFKIAEKYYNSSISIPIYPQLNRKDQNYIITILNKLDSLK